MYVCMYVLSNNLSDDQDILRQCKHIYVQGNTLIIKFHMCSHEVKLTLFRTFCASMYTSNLWYNYRQCIMNKLVVAYNNCLRILLNIPRYQNGINYSASKMFVTNEIANCSAVIKKLIYSLKTRIDKSLNSIIINIVHSDLRYVSKLRKQWMESLYVHYHVQY